MKKVQVLQDAPVISDTLYDDKSKVIETLDKRLEKEIIELKSLNEELSGGLGKKQKMQLEHLISVENSLRNENVVLKQDRESLSNHIVSLKEENSRLNNDLENITRKLEISEQEIKKTFDLFNCEQLKVSQIEERVVMLATELDESLKKNNDLQLLLDNVNENLLSVNAQLDVATSMKKQLQVEIDNLINSNRQEDNMLEKKLITITQQLEEVTNLNVLLKQDVDDLKRINRNCSEASEIISRDLNNNCKKKDEYIDELISKIESLQQEILTVKNDYKIKLTENSEKITDSKKLYDTISALQELNNLYKLQLEDSKVTITDLNDQISGQIILFMDSNDSSNNVHEQEVQIDNQLSTINKFQEEIENLKSQLIEKEINQLEIIKEKDKITKDYEILESLYKDLTANLNSISIENEELNRNLIEWNSKYTEEKLICDEKIKLLFDEKEQSIFNNLQLEMKIADLNKQVDQLILESKKNSPDNSNINTSSNSSMSLLLVILSMFISSLKVDKNRVNERNLVEVGTPSSETDSVQEDDEDNDMVVAAARAVVETLQSHQKSTSKRKSLLDQSSEIDSAVSTPIIKLLKSANTPMKSNYYLDGSPLVRELFSQKKQRDDDLVDVQEKYKIELTKQMEG